MFSCFSTSFFIKKIMKIVTVQFDYPHRPKYSLLLKIFRESVKIYMPGVELIEFRTDAPVNKTGRPLNFNYNDFKLNIWLEYLNKTDENVIFADCDMMAIKNAEHAFDIPFDVAFTARTIVKRIPMNGGIMMARPTAAARAFFKEMRDVNRKMLKDVDFHHRWRRRYAGMNQSAFGYTYEQGHHGAKVHKYKTLEWNAVDCDWHLINNSTVFVHYKSKLRKLILANKIPFGNYKKVMKMWYDMRNKFIDIRDMKRIEKIKIQELHDLTAERDKKIEENKEKDRKIRYNKIVIKEKDRQIKENKIMIKEKTKMLKANLILSTERDKKLKELISLNKEKDKKIEELEEITSRRDKKNKELNSITRGHGRIKLTSNQYIIRKKKKKRVRSKIIKRRVK